MALIVRELDIVPYREALALQESLVGRKLDGDADNYLLVLEHEPVYTLGRAADERDLHGADVRLGVEAVRVGRGGGVTFHGPGQLVAYPIIDLAPHRRDVQRYVRALETVLIGVCARLGVAAARRPGAPGVWVGGAKIASIGVGIRRWITFHGVALNVSPDLSFFSQIVPCRMPDLRMTSLARETRAPISVADARSLLIEEFLRVFENPRVTSPREVNA
jgi:lipoate-protein ligase B